MSKRMLSMMLTMICVLALIVSACGNGNGNGNGNSETPAASNTTKNTSEEPAEPKEPVTINFWGGLTEEVMQPVIDNWNDANPDIQVNYVRFVNDEAGNVKLDIALLSNTDAPDLFVSYNDTLKEKRVSSNMAAPLDDLIKESGFDLEGVIGSSNILKTDGKIYYLPGNKSLGAMLINKSALDEIGEEVPTVWTWEDLEVLAGKLTTDDRKGMLFIPGWEPAAVNVLATAQPNEPFFKPDGSSNLDHPAFKKGLEIQKRMYDSGSMVPYAEGVANKLNPSIELLTGKVAMTWGGLWQLNAVKDEAKYPGRDFQVSFVPTPQYEEGGKVNLGGLGDYISINANSEYKEEAMTFLAHYLSEGNNALIPSGRVPSNKSADTSKIVDSLIGDMEKYIDRESLNYLFSQDWTYPVKTINAPMPDTLKAWMEESEKYFMDVQDIDTTVEVLTQRANDAIAAVKE